MRALAASLLLVVACTRSPSQASAAEEPSATTTKADTPAAAAEVAEAGGKIRVVAATQDEAVLSLVRTERLKAKAEGRVLVVYVSAKWCEPCKKLKAEIEAGRLDGRLGRTTLLAFDADADVDRLSSAGYAFKFVPYVALPGADGRPADAQEASGSGGGAWRALLGKLEAWQGT